MGTIPDLAGLAIFPAIAAIIGSARYLRARVPPAWRGRLGLALGLLGLLMGIVWIIDLMQQLSFGGPDFFLEPCDLSPFCRDLS